MRSLCLFLLALCASLLAASPASAHFLISDRSIGAVLHIDPDDSPIAGQPATIIYSFGDKQGLFQAADCACTLHILQGGTQVSTVSPQVADASTLSLTYVFPTTGIYTLRLEGHPLTSGGFQDFVLSYNQRVDRQGAAVSRSLSLPTVVLGLAAGLVVVSALALLLRARLAPPQKGADSQQDDKASPDQGEGGGTPAS